MYLPILILTHLCFVAYVLVYQFQKSSWWSYLYFILSLLLNTVSYFGIIHAAENSSFNSGTGGDYFDLFVLTCLCEISYCFTSYAALLLLMIPVRLAYIWLPTIKSLLFPSRNEDTTGQLPNSDDGDYRKVNNPKQSKAKTRGGATKKN